MHHQQVKEIPVDADMDMCCEHECANDFCGAKMGENPADSCVVDGDDLGSCVGSGSRMGWSGWM